MAITRTNSHSVLSWRTPIVVVETFSMTENIWHGTLKEELRIFLQWLIITAKNKTFSRTSIIWYSNNTLNAKLIAYGPQMLELDQGQYSKTIEEITVLLCLSEPRQRDVLFCNNRIYKNSTTWTKVSPRKNFLIWDIRQTDSIRLRRKKQFEENLQTSMHSTRGQAFKLFLERMGNEWYYRVLSVL